MPSKCTPLSSSWSNVKLKPGFSAFTRAVAAYAACSSKLRRISSIGPSRPTVIFARIARPCAGINVTGQCWVVSHRLVRSPSCIPHRGRTPLMPTRTNSEHTPMSCQIALSRFARCLDHRHLPREHEPTTHSLVLVGAYLYCTHHAHAMHACTRIYMYMYIYYMYVACSWLL